jgi:hypothetical protein
MSTIVRQLSSGETMVFDKNKRELYLVHKGHSANSVEDAEILHSKGSASKFDKSQLGALNQALSHIVLLGA